MVLLVTRFLRGLSRIGPVVLDCEVSTQVTLTHGFSERRIAAGVRASDHSENEPEDLVIAGVVDSISPLTPVGLASLGSGQYLQYERLADLVRSGDELRVVCARGRFLVTARSFTVTDTKQTGFSSQFTMTLRPVQRGKAKIVTTPTGQSAALVGSGQTQALGPTSTTSVTL